MRTTETAADELVPCGWRVKLLAFALKYVPPLRYLWLRLAFLRRSGFVASAWANAPVDAAGQPLAWYTYAALHFLEPRLRPDMRVFEFGAGHSTLWWAARVASVRSVESDQAWVERLRPRLPPNATVAYAPLGTPDGAYARAARDTGDRFDIIVIDGFDRNHCAFNCLEALKEDGVIIWDNSDWTHLFAEGLEFLEHNGFARLDFSGVGPLNGYGWCTSIFYRRTANNLRI